MIGYSALVVVIVALGDAPFPDVDLSQTPTEQPQYIIFHLDMDVARCVKKLRRELGEDGNTRIVCDEANNAILIKASPEKLKKAREILYRLDDRPPGRLMNLVLPLTHTDAETIVPRLKLFLSFFAWLADDVQPPSVAAEGSGKYVIVQGSKEGRELAKVLVRLLDVEKK